VLQAKVGDYRRQGEPLAEIHARSAAEAVSIQAELLACYTWSDEPVQAGPLIHDVIRPS
jgi:thymidine phosphorylase